MRASKILGTLFFRSDRCPLTVALLAEESRETLLERRDRGRDMEESCRQCHHYTRRPHSAARMGRTSRGTRYRTCHLILVH